MRPVSCQRAHMSRYCSALNLSYHLPFSVNLFSESQRNRQTPYFDRVLCYLVRQTGPHLAIVLGASSPSSGDSGGARELFLVPRNCDLRTRHLTSYSALSQGMYPSFVPGPSQTILWSASQRGQPRMQLPRRAYMTISSSEYTASGRSFFWSVVPLFSPHIIILHAPRTYFCYKEPPRSSATSRNVCKEPAWITLTCQRGPSPD